MSTVNDLKDWDDRFVRKGLVGSVFVADYDATAITSVFAVDHTLAALPAGYVDSGYISEDGVTASRDVSSEDLTPWQSLSPIRSDKTADKRTFSATLLEMNRVSIALSDDIPLADVPAMGDDFEILSNDAGVSPYRRVLVIAQDGDDANAIYFGRFYPKCKVTDFGDENIQRTDAASQELTFTAFMDTAYGASSMRILGGPGWVALT